MMCYFKNYHSICLLTNFFDNQYLVDYQTNEWLNEMTALYKFYENNSDICFVLPSITHKDSNLPQLYENFFHFNTIFDPAAYGVYLLGNDTIHTNGKIVIYTPNMFSHQLLKTTSENAQWVITNGMKKPYIVTDNGQFLINNLHVHSKDLLSGLSIEY